MHYPRLKDALVFLESEAIAHVRGMLGVTGEVGKISDQNPGEGEEIYLCFCVFLRLTLWKLTFFGKCKVNIFPYI